MMKPLNLSPKILLIIGGTVITSAIAFYGLWRYQSYSQTSISESVMIETKVTAVAAIGYIEPQGEVIKLSAPAFQEGTRVEKLLVAEGDMVKQGDIIAILDNHQRLLATVKQAEAKLQLAKSKLEKVKQGAKKADIEAQRFRFQRIQAELQGQIISQKADIKNLQAQLQGEFSAQQATIDRVKAELKNAIADCQRYESLYLDGAVSEGERDDFCLEAETEQESLEEAQAHLQRVKETLLAQIQSAEANLQRTIKTLAEQIEEKEAQLESIREIRPIDVQIAEHEFNLAQREVQRSQAEFDLSYVRSPQDGRILKVNTLAGELLDKDGIVELGFTKQMYVNAEVYETDINRVKIGQPATIKTDNIIGELEGVVEKIGWQIARQDVLNTDPVADTDARVVEVKIRLNPSFSDKVAQLTNLKVNVIIQTDD